MKLSLMNAETIDFPAVGETDVQVDLLELAREIHVPRFPAIVHIGKDDLIASGRCRLTIWRGTGDGVDHSLHLEVHLGAEVLLDQRALCFYCDSSVRFTIVFVFITHQTFRRRQARAE